MRLCKVLLFFLTAGFLISCGQKKEVQILLSANSSNRVQFGIEKLKEKLLETEYTVSDAGISYFNSEKISVIAGDITDSEYLDFLKEHNWEPAQKLEKEGFSITKVANAYIVTGADASGALYGCLELKEQLEKNGELPATIDQAENPQMVMRGTCIGLQKTAYLPGRTVYEYPYTPENFPWFYDKELWVKYLDLMVENRYNSLYLWNGHPFASLVKLDDYPYAVEVSDSVFKMNEEIFSFLTEEADKRGIWVIQMFYNIIVSKPFAETNNMKTQDRGRPIIPIISDYTRKSIAAFIEKYPNVGLLVTLGEAMNTIDDDVEWFTKTIIPGVKDGLDALGITEEPPIVLRGHDTKAGRVMDAALPIYKNLYTTFKYNGESLTTYQPRESWSYLPTALSELGSVHISNVHILANLEPFRYGSPDFIQKSVKAMHSEQGANGLHLYPQASYWDWPYSADNTKPRLLEMERDWIWYKAWGRYAWNDEHDSISENKYWSDELNDYYGCASEGEKILKAYVETGEIAPKLLRTFGISDGNRQTLLLGMFMGQLVNPFKYRVYSNFWSSSGPLKEVLIQYAEKEANGEEHVGETPPRIISEVVAHGEEAVKAIEAASAEVTKNQEEFKRLKNDVYCYDAFANFFNEKVKAAMLVLKYQYSNNVEDLEQALPHLEKSLGYYKQLVSITHDTYLYANSMQTQQRRIPISGADGKNKTWEELLPHFQTEYDNFKRNIEKLKSGGTAVEKHGTFNPAKVQLLGKNQEWYPVKKGAKVYSDGDYAVNEVAEELCKLKGVRFSQEKQRDEGSVLKFKSDKAVKVMVGYFSANSYSVLKPPTLETNAQANNRGQADIRIANAMLVDGLYPVNIYTYKFDAGENELVLGKGRVLILGFIDGNDEIDTYDAGISGSEATPPVDWLFN